MTKDLFNIVIGLTLCCHALYAGNLHELIATKNTAEALSLIPKKSIDELNELVAGDSLLHLAVKQNLLEVVKRLVKAKADKNILSSDNETPALLALKLNRHDILLYLILAKATFEGEGLYNFISRTHKESDLEKTLVQDDIFTAQILPMLHHEGAREVLPFIYPLFARDEEFLKELALIITKGQRPDWQLSQVLYAMITANYPNGLPTKTAVHWISGLLSEMHASPMLRFRMWTGLKAKRDHVQKRKHRASKTLPSQLDAYKKEFDDADAHTIAMALTDHDARMFQAISLAQIRLWLKDKNNAHAISDCFLAHNKLSNFFSYLLVSESNAQLRRKRLEKMLRVVKELETLNNFWGMKHLIAGITKSEVMRVFEGEKLGPIEQTLKNKSLLLDDLDQQYYHKKISNLDPNQPRIPLINHFFTALSSAITARPKPTSPEKAQLDWLIALGNLIKEFNNHKHLSAYQNPSDKVATEIFDGALIIPDDVIIEFSNLQNPWTLIQLKREPPTTKMPQWTTLDLYSYLDHHGTPEITSKLLKGGIWDGEALINLLTHMDGKEAYKELLGTMKAMFQVEE